MHACWNQPTETIQLFLGRDVSPNERNAKVGAYLLRAALLLSDIGGAVAVGNLANCRTDGPR
jgi:hypothetical protein